MAENNTIPVANQNVPAYSVSPTAPPPPQSAAVNATKTNYAAAVFFTLLIVGFTFHLPGLLYVPLMFFTIAAGVFFLKDVLKANRQPGAVVYVQTDGTQVGSTQSKPKKIIPFWLKVLLIVFGTIGVCALAYVAFIVYILILLGGSGV